MRDAVERWSGLLFGDVDGSGWAPVFQWDDGQLRSARLCFDVEELEDGRGVPREGVEAVSAALEHPSLRELTVGIQLTWDDDEYADLGDLSALWPMLPSLERLILHADHLQLGEVTLPQLETLEVQFTLTHEHGRHALTGAHWPSLENVALHVGDTQFGSEATTKDLAGILECCRACGIICKRYCCRESWSPRRSNRSAPCLPSVTCRSTQARAARRGSRALAVPVMPRSMTCSSGGDASSEGNR
jgi:hypothetical protein